MILFICWRRQWYRDQVSLLSAKSCIHFQRKNEQKLNKEQQLWHQEQLLWEVDLYDHYIATWKNNIDRHHFQSAILNVWIDHCVPTFIHENCWLDHIVMLWHVTHWQNEVYSWTSNPLASPTKWCSITEINDNCFVDKFWLRIVNICRRDTIVLVESWCKLRLNPARSASTLKYRLLNPKIRLLNSVNCAHILHTSC